MGDAARARRSPDRGDMGGDPRKAPGRPDRSLELVGTRRAVGARCRGRPSGGVPRQAPRGRGHVGRLTVGRPDETSRAPVGRSGDDPWQTPSMVRRFSQVDVFTDVLYRGNPVAVVHDAAGIDDGAMLGFARWTNLSETTFLLPPDDPSADYRVR